MRRRDVRSSLAAPLSRCGLLGAFHPAHAERF
jgi:hypothetical protein